MRFLFCIQDAKGALSRVKDCHLALRKAGIDSKILCMSEENDSLGIMKYDTRSNIIDKTFFRLLKRSANLFGLSHVPNLISSQFVNTLKNLEFDILFVNSARATVSYLAFPQLTKKTPTIFSVSSMWSFTGHCFHSLDCDRWKIGCGECPKLYIQPPIKRDNTRLEWKLKDWAYRHSNLTIVTSSNWLTAQVKQSMLKRFPVHQIPPGIDTEIFKPYDKKQSRVELGISPAKKVLAFASARMGDYLKGGDLLLKALEGLPESLKSDSVLLLMGRGGENITKNISIETVNLGYLSDHHQKSIYYSAADLFLFPTRAETFGLVSIESMACGTPIVSFRVGGVSDHVRPGITGYLAEPENVQDFRNGIIQLLEDESLRIQMSQQCRSVAVEEYDLKLWVQQYIQLCNSLI